MNAHRLFVQGEHSKCPAGQAKGHQPSFHHETESDAMDRNGRESSQRLSPFDQLLNQLYFITYILLKVTIKLLLLQDNQVSQVYSHFVHYSFQLF